MGYSITILKVNDFDEWKTSFDGSAEMRKAAGEKTFQVLRSVDDPNSVVVTVEWGNLEAAKKFLDSDQLKTKLKEAGVLEFNAYYLEEVSKGTL